MTHNNVPILIITAPPPASDNQNQDTTTQALKQHRPASHNRGNGNKSNPRVRKPKPNDKSELFRRNEVSISYNNASLLSIEKKLHDESVLDNMSISSRSIFSTESPRDIKTVTTLKPNSYYLGVINPNEPSRISQNNPKNLYVGRSVFPSITLDESNINIHKNEGSTVIENDPKNAGKVNSLSSVQTKRPPSIGNKLYHGFRRPYASQNLSDQTESFEMPRLGSPQQNDLKPHASEKNDKEKHAEEPIHVPRPPSKGPLNKARTLAPPPALDHRRPKKVGTEASSIVVKSNLDLDSKAYNSVPIDYTPQSMINLPSQDNTLEAGSLVIDPNSMMKHHRRLRPDVDRRAINRTSLNGRSLKDNELYPHSDVSNSQVFYQSIKIPLKPLSGNANAAKRALNSRGPNSELRGSSKDDLMKRFNDIVAYQLQPGQAGNPQVLPEKNKNEGNGLRAGANSKEKEHTKRRPVKPQDENKQTGSEAQKGKKPAEVSIINPTDAKIMMLKNKIKDKEYKRKTRKNQCLEEGEGVMTGIPLKSKFAEHMENKGEMEEDMKKRLLVMRKIQLYDILIKQKTGKKLKKEVLKLVKTEFDKVNQELSELKLHEH